MERVFERTVRVSEHEYRVSVDFDDQEIMKDSAVFPITGAVRKVGSPDSEWRSVSLRVEVDFANEIIEIFHDQRVIAKISLNLEVPDAADFDGSDLDIEQETKVIEDAMGPEAAEAIVELFPVDPFLGCLIRGAVSTLIGQIIRCYKQMRQSAKGIGDLVSNIAGCLREYSLRMAFTFMWRAGKCIASAGLPSF